MGEDISKHQLKEIDKQIIEKEKNKMLSKDLKVNYPIGDDLQFDDFYRVSQFRSAYKVCKIVISKDIRSNYITGLQFSYNQISNPAIVIQGNEMGKIHPHSSTSFTLKDDEYITQLKGRNGMIIDNFGFLTSHNNYYNFGGVGGQQYSYTAPQGFHYNNFGAYFSVQWVSISSFAADIQAISSSTEISPQQKNLAEMLIKKPIFRSIIGYLNVKEIARLFLVNKQMSMFRYDEYVVGQLGLRCVFSCDNNLFNYMNQLKQHCPNSTQIFSRYLYQQEVCSNLIQNPSGEKGKEGYKIVGNITPQCKNNVNYFQVNPNWLSANISWIFDMKQNLSVQERKQITQGTLVLVAGVQIAESGYGTRCRITLIITYENGETCIEYKLLHKLTRDLLSYSVIHRRIQLTDNLPITAEIQLQLEESSQWPSRVRQISFRKFPYEEEQEIRLLNQLQLGQISEIVQTQQ